MKRICVLMVIVFLLSSVACFAKQNPSAGFCEEQGGKYKINKDTKGNEDGVCVFKDKEEKAWKLYREKKPKEQKPDEPKKDVEARGAVEDTRQVSSRLVSYPPSIDWRNNNGDWTTPVKNQGACGSCWAFAAVGVVESAANIGLNNPDYDINLAEQHIVSCDHTCIPGYSWPSSYCQNGCSGGYTPLALEFMKNTGIVKEACFPYTATNQNCNNICPNWNNELTTIGYGRVIANPDSIKQVITDYGPVTADIRSCQAFDYYTGGVYTNANFVSCGWHGIDIVGYDDANQYWIAKNSWGTGWGENGYIRIAYSESIYDYQGWESNPNDYRTLFLDASYAATSTSLSGAGSDGDCCNAYDLRISALEQWKKNIDSQNLNARISILEQWKTTISNTIDAMKQWLFFPSYPGADLCEAIENECATITPIACYADPDCGTDNYTQNYCSGNDVYADHKGYTCNNPGTEASYCSYKSTPALRQQCGELSCVGGECREAGDVIFRTNAKVKTGVSAYSGSSNWIAFDVDKDGSLDGLGFKANYIRMSYCKNYPIVSFTPDGYPVVQNPYSSTMIFVCPSNNNYVDGYAYLKGYGSAGSAVTSSYPTEPYSSNGQERY